MLVLERKGNEVFCNGVKLKINPQASKGANKEVVSIKGLDGANGQNWVSLSKLKEGINEIETRERVIKNGAKYYLTEEERARIEEIDKEKEAIIEGAKQRYESCKNLDKVDPSKMSQSEIDKMIENLLLYKKSLEG
jgi:hypothetical protein